MSYLRVLILLFNKNETPGSIENILKKKNIRYQIKLITTINDIPTDIKKYSGLILMGGPMSANDPIDWIDPIISLIQTAIKSNISLLGHCLGAQLISKALGAKVINNLNKEIGWFPVKTIQCDNELSAQLFGAHVTEFLAFHWHGETFNLPRNARLLLSSQHCQNQAYAYKNHLALQCHLEISKDLVNTFCKIGNTEIKENQHTPSVQEVDEILNNLEQKCNALQKIANHVYDAWIKNLKILN